MPLALLTFFAFRLALAAAIIPPWQVPDEPQHFAIVRILLERGGWDLSERRNARVERQILASMSDYHWWRHYGDATPDPLPADLAAMPQHTWPADSQPPAYYLLATAFVRAVGGSGLLDQFYALRLLSMLLGFLTLLVAWMGTRTLLGAKVAAGSTALLALHPQFALMSIGVNPSALVHLCAAVIWWQAARLLTGRRPIVSMTILGLATILAVATKRVALPLVIVALFILAVAAVRNRRIGWRRWGVGLAATLGMATLVFAGLILAFPGELLRLRESLEFFLLANTRTDPFDWAALFSFGRNVADSAWLYVGWLRYPAPAGWWGTAHTIWIAGLAGLLVLPFRRGQRPSASALVLALGFVLIQVTTIYLMLFVTQVGYGAQGHYLFPAIVPFLCLVWIGFLAWWPASLRPYAATLLVAVMAALDFFAWTQVAIPPYAY